MLDIPRRFSKTNCTVYILVAMAVISFFIFYQNYSRSTHPKMNLYSRLGKLKYVLAKDKPAIDGVMKHKNMAFGRLVAIAKAGGKKSRTTQELASIKQTITENPLQNISVNPITGDLVSVLSDSADFTHETFYSILTKSGSDFKPNYNKWIIPEQRICEGRAPFLLIIIPSVIENNQQRRAIRKTWMAAARTNSWPRRDIKKTVRHLFFLAKSPSFNANTLKRLIHESKQYHDIVLSDMVDSYGNLSLKMISALTWAKKYCHTAKFIMKSDEDTFINVPLLLEVISRVDEEVTSGKFVLGRAHASTRPEVTRKGKWAVSEDQYPFDTFPRYLYGHSYVISQPGLSSLLTMVGRVKLVSQEDAFVTGILAKLTDVTRLDAQCFALCCVDLYDCDIVLNIAVTMTAADAPWDHGRMWESVSRRQCHPQVAFNHARRHPNVKPNTNIGV